MAIISKTSTQWAALPNHVLPLNDTGYETDTYRRKIGDGVSKWKDLDYVALIQLRGDTKANWSAKNPVIGKREKVVETDTNREKIGDGIKRYSELRYTDQDLVDKTVQLEQPFYKNDIPLSSIAIAKGLTDFIIDIYIDYTPIEGKEYSFAVLNPIQNLFTLYEQNKPDPTVDLKTVATFRTFTKVGKYYKFINENSWVVVDWDRFKTLNSDTLFNMYYTNGVGLKSDVFKIKGIRESVFELKNNLSTLEKTENELNVSVLTSNFNISVEAARNAVPENQRQLGKKITYKTDNVWISEQFRGISASDWGNDNKWFGVNVDDNRIKNLEGEITTFAFVANGYVNKNGVIVETNSFCRTDYITIDKTSDITVNAENANQYLYVVAFFDASKNFISGISQVSSPYTIDKATYPSNAVYFIASSTPANNAWHYVMNGSVKTSINNIRINQSLLDAKIDNTKTELSSEIKLIDSKLETSIVWTLLTQYTSTGAYTNKGVGQYTRKMLTSTLCNTFIAKSLKGNGAHPYKLIKYKGSVGEKECPFGTLLATPTIIKEGVLLLDTTFKDYEIGFPSQVIGKEEQVILLVGNNNQAQAYFDGKFNKDILPAEYNVCLFTANDSPLSTEATWSPGVGSYGYGAFPPELWNKSNIPNKQEIETIINEKGYTTPKDVNDLINKDLSVPISLPDRLYAVVGDVFQLFFRGVLQAVDPYRYDILITCQKGIKYPRYFQYVPTTNDIGSTPFKITVKDDKNNILSEKECLLITNDRPKSPTSKINVLCFGDSLTSAGTWCAELDRRLTGSGGDPMGNNLSNIKFCGAKTIGTTGYFGVGGWSWESYTTQGRPAYRFQVSGVTSLAVGAIYTNNGNTFTIMEVNITGDTGNILCSVSNIIPAPTSSGTLTKTSGTGDTTISFSSAAQDSQNPLWDYANNKMTFIPYANTYCNGQIDVVYTLLSWNGQTPWRTDFTSVITEIKKFADTLHSEYPNAKLKIMGVQVCSVKGGMGVNYGATGTSYADQYGMVVTALNQNKAYQDLANLPEYSSFVEFVNISSQFDTDYNMPNVERNVNTRSTKTELVDQNGVHPSNAGYYQIADVVYRNFIANYCQQ